MAANRARAVLFGLVLALCAAVSPADASLPDPYSLAGDDLAAEHVLELLRETAAAAPTLPEPAAAPAFTLWPEPPPPDGHLFARTPEPPLLEPAVRGLRTALEEAASLPETRIRACGLFEPHLRLGRSRASRENATGYGLGLRETYVGPTQKGLWTDPVTGLAYARARWYDPRNASWLSEDPLLDIDSPNLYAFVAWQPSMGRDPMGTCFTGGIRCLRFLADTARGAAERVSDYFTEKFGDTAESGRETAESARQTDRVLFSNMGNRDPVIDRILADDFEGLELPRTVGEQQIGELGESLRAIEDTGRHVGRTAGDALSAADRYLLGTGLYKIAVIGGRRVVVRKGLGEGLAEGVPRGVIARGDAALEFVPSRYRADVARSFRGEPVAETLAEDLVVYRRWGGRASEAGSPWFSPQPYARPGNARRYLALPEANTAENLTAFKIPAGTTILRGKVGSRAGEVRFGSNAVGGGVQIYLPDPSAAVPIR